MNNSSQCDISAPQEDVRESSTKNTPEKTVEVSTLREKMMDTTTVESNPKIDHHLLSEFYRVTGEYERLCRRFKGYNPQTETGCRLQHSTSARIQGQGDRCSSPRYTSEHYQGKLIPTKYQ